MYVSLKRVIVFLKATLNNQSSLSSVYDAWTMSPYKIHLVLNPIIILHKQALSKGFHCLASQNVPTGHPEQDWNSTVSSETKLMQG